MAFTTHGHRIPGSVFTMELPKNVTRCGGVRFCDQCKQEVEAYKEKQESEMKSYRPSVVSEGLTNPGTEMRPEDPISKAKKLLRDHVDWQYKRSAHRDAELPAYEVYVVLFAYILGGWKATLSTDRPDGKYYELTYNASKKETYIDEYTKTINVVVPDTD